MNFITHVTAAMRALANASGNYQLRGGGITTVAGLFTDPHEVINLGMAGMSGRRITLAVVTTDLPVGYSRGDVLTVLTLNDLAYVGPAYTVEEYETHTAAGKTVLILKVKP